MEAHHPFATLPNVSNSWDLSSTLPLPWSTPNNVTLQQNCTMYMLQYNQKSTSSYAQSSLRMWQNHISCPNVSIFVELGFLSPEIFWMTWYGKSRINLRLKTIWIIRNFVSSELIMKTGINAKGKYFTIDEEIATSNWLYCTSKLRSSYLY